MANRITPKQFHEAEGVEDWRVLAFGACTYFRTGSFATGVKLVDMIGKLAEAANHHPDIDLRYAGVTVRLFTHDILGLSASDIELAVRSPQQRALWTSPPIRRRYRTSTSRSTRSSART